MKILGLADLHDQSRILEELEGLGLDVDLMALCGDLHDGGLASAAMPVLEILRRFEVPKLAVPGNMDPRSLVEAMWPEAGLIILHRRIWIRGDWGFMGMGGMVLRRPPRSGDEDRYFHQESDVETILKGLHSQLEQARWKVVMIHQPPRGCQDLLYNAQLSGSQALREFIETYEPDLALCGHIHEDQGASHIGKTLVVNVGEARRGKGALIREKNGHLEVEWLDL